MIGVPGMASTRRSIKIEKPRPLKISLGDQSMESVLSEMDLVSQQLNANNFDRGVYSAVVSLCENLKMFGHQLESVYKDQLDRCYVALRNGCRDDRLTLASRYRLLEVIELRAMHWQPNENLINYYKQKLAQIEAEEATLGDQQSVEISGYMTTGALLTPTTGVTTPVFPGQYPAYPTQPVIYATQTNQHPQQIITQNSIPGTPPPPVPTLGPGEVIKNSGKYTKPMRIPGKNYCKDEIVIRNADSGKVMGLKGRRVHMIEELSETIISFQRVAPGARERLVQITGPTEENIQHAKQLIEETIRRNASPARCEERDTIFTSLGGSSSSISSHGSDDPLQGTKRNPLHGGSLDDALGEYRYTVVHENDVLRITGNNLDLVRTAKLILDEYFNGEQNLNTHSSSNGSDSDQTTYVTASPKTTSPPKSMTPPKTVILPSKSSPPLKTPSPPGVLSRSKSTLATSESYSSSSKVQQNGDFTSKETSSATENSKTAVVTIVRQPLIPMSTKEAIESAEKSNQDSTNENVKNRRMLFAKTSDERSSQQATDESDGHSTPAPLNSPRVTYTRDFLVKCSDSSLCRLTPANWAQVVRQNPTVVKKSYQYLTGMLAKMNENGDICMNSATTYLQDGDLLRMTDLEQLKMQWSLLRTTSAIDDEDNGNSLGGSP